MVFYFDENLPYQIAKALDILDKKNDVFSVKKDFEGFKDLELIPEISKRNGVLITFDKNMRRNRMEKKALEENEMIVFFLASKLNYWDLAKLFVKIWSKIVSKARRAKRPYFFRITGKGKIEDII